VCDQPRSALLRVRDLNHNFEHSTDGRTDPTKFICARSSKFNRVYLSKAKNHRRTKKTIPIKNMPSSYCLLRTSTYCWTLRLLLTNSFSLAIQRVFKVYNTHEIGAAKGTVSAARHSISLAYLGTNDPKRRLFPLPRKDVGIHHTGDRITHTFAFSATDILTRNDAQKGRTESKNSRSKHHIWKTLSNLTVADSSKNAFRSNISNLLIISSD
jgi:hypothetical protein